MSQGKALGRFISSIFLAALTAALFIFLGFWQLDRAQQSKELSKPYLEKPKIALSDVAQPDTNLSGASVNRIVTFSGQYVMSWDSPNQIDRNGRQSTWSVGLMDVDGGGSILVVRSTTSQELPKGDINVTGRLLPRQFEDRNDGAMGTLRRIDPALVTQSYSGSLYDGFVVAVSEVQNGNAITAPRVQVDPARPTIPGYYWQHIAYVVIWWLMALVVLFLPIYSRYTRESRDSRDSNRREKQ